MADANPAYLSLDTRGVIRGMKQKAAALLDAYFASNASQSNLFYGQVKSIAKDIQKAGDNVNQAGSFIQSSLSELFGNYYEDVMLNVQVVDQPGNTGKADIVVSMLLTNEEGETMNLVSLASSEDGQRWQNTWTDAPL